MTTRTFAGALVATLGFSACSGATTSQPTTTATTSSVTTNADTSTSTTLGVDDQKAADVAESFAQGVQAAASADGIEITDEESACMSKAILSGLGAPRLIALAAQGGDIDSLDPADRSAMLEAITTCVAPDKLLGAGLDASASDDPYHMAELLAASITGGLTHQGVTITSDQKACMATNISDTFAPDELMRAALDSEAGKPNDPAIESRAVDAVIGCLPADVIKALANPNA